MATTTATITIASPDISDNRFLYPTQLHLQSWYYTGVRSNNWV
jgi:hypothetical protein